MRPLSERLVDGGESLAGRGGVVEADDREVAGHRQAALTSGQPRGVRERIAEREHGRDAGCTIQQRAGAGNDRITGGAGRDKIDVGAGCNRASGGAGRDVIRARNRRHDRIACGSGRAKVVADTADRVGGDCEAVRIR
jgi:hypothetical protein